METGKLKILYIMNALPSYEIYNDKPRPTINWNTGDGNWVGIWGYDWGDLLGNAVLKQSDNIDFEVLQIDLRADSIYEHRFPGGLKHMLFPACKINRFGNTTFVSEKLYEYIEKESRHSNVVLNTGANGIFSWEIAKYFKKLPIIATWHGTINLPYQKIFRLRKNLLKYSSYIKMHNLFKESVNNFNLITYQNDDNLALLKEFYKGPLEKITMGVDFNEFTPMDKALARNELHLPSHKKIFLTVSRLNSLKQIDKVIKVFNSLNKDFDFLLIVLGHGSREYEAYLKKLAKPLIENNKILLPGYIRGQDLVKYYNAADLFMMVSKSEAGPVISMEALACNQPVMTTDTGRVAELLNENGAGIVVGKKSYHEWQEKIIEILKGKDVPKLDHAVAEQQFSWPNIASRFIASYNYVAKLKYLSSKHRI